MKSLDDVQEKMSSLYEQVENESMDLKKADSLANIAGKYLKAEQLKFAREVFLATKRPQPAIEAEDVPVRPAFPSAGQLIASGQKKAA